MLEEILKVLAGVDPLLAVVVVLLSSIVVYVQKKADKREAQLQLEAADVRKDERETYKTVLISLDKIADGMRAQERDRERNHEFQTNIRRDVDGLKKDIDDLPRDIALEIIAKLPQSGN